MSVFQTILLQDKQGENYCIACRELDTDTSKDDPGMQFMTWGWGLVQGLTFSLLLPLFLPSPLPPPFSSPSLVSPLPPPFSSPFLLSPHFLPPSHPLHPCHLKVLINTKTDPLKQTGRSSSIGSEFAWHASGPEFDPHVRHILSWRLGHENISRATLPLSLIQKEQLSVTGKRICTKYW